MGQLNLSSVLEHPARLTPDRVAITCGPQQLTYAELNARATQVAAGLHAMGIRAGDHVALSCPNIPWFPIAYFGILKAGAAVVPLNVLLKPREIAYHLKDSEAKAMLAFEGTPELPIGAMCRDGAAQAGTPHVIVFPGDAESVHAGPGRVSPAAARPARHRRHPLHVRHDGASQRGRADARQHGEQRHHVPRHVQAGVRRGHRNRT